MEKNNLSIVIPAFNEEANLKKGCLKEVIDYLKDKDLNVEVLVIDDGSTDATARIVAQQIKNEPKFKLIKESHGGKAIAVMKGLLKSRGHVALFTDMDQATPISEIEKLLPKFEEGFDVVIGSRKGRKGAPLIRKLAAFGFSTLRILILGLPFKDTQCGFKAFSQKSIEEIFPLLLKRWNKAASRGSAVNAGFDVEVLYVAKKMEFKIAEVDVEWHHVGTERVQIIKDALEAAEDIIRIKLNDLLGRY